MADRDTEEERGNVYERDTSYVETEDEKWDNKNGVR